MDTRKREPQGGYKEKVLCLVETLDEQKEKRLLIQNLYNDRQAYKKGNVLRRFPFVM